MGHGVKLPSLFKLVLRHADTLTSEDGAQATHQMTAGYVRRPSCVHVVNRKYKSPLKGPQDEGELCNRFSVHVIVLGFIGVHPPSKNCFTHSQITCQLVCRHLISSMHYSFSIKVCDKLCLSWTSTLASCLTLVNINNWPFPSLRLHFKMKRILMVTMEFCLAPNSLM